MFWLVENLFTIIWWISDLSKCQGTGKICSFKRGFVISGFCSIHFAASKFGKASEHCRFVIAGTSL